MSRLQQRRLSNGARSGSGPSRAAASYSACTTMGKYHDDGSAESGPSVSGAPRCARARSEKGKNGSRRPPTASIVGRLSTTGGFHNVLGFGGQVPNYVNRRG